MNRDKPSAETLKRALEQNANELNGAKSQTTQGGSWGEIIPFEELRIKPLAFPVSAFPPIIAEYLTALSTFTQTAPEMGGVLMLGVMGALFGGRYFVRRKGDHTEQLNIYSVAVADPSERKSAVLSAVTKPFHAFESRYNKEHNAAFIESANRKKLLETRLNKVRDALAAEKGMYSDLTAAVENYAAFVEKKPLRLMCDDCTPERLIQILAEQNGAVCLTSGEGGVFDRMTNKRYNGNGEIETYLKAYSGDFIRTDRVGRTGESVESPALSIILTVQPQVIDMIMSNDTLRRRGLIARFSYALCAKKAGGRQIDAPEIPHDVQAAYDNLLTAWLEHNAARTDAKPAELTLSETAYKRYLEFAEYVERRIDKEFEHFADWAGKATGLMLRIAGGLHLIRQTPKDPDNPFTENDVEPHKQPIDAQTVDNAVKLVQCLISHASAIFAPKTDEFSAARYVLKRLTDSGKTELSRTELHALTRGRFARADELNAPIEALKATNHVRVEERRTGDKGKPTVVIIVNPALISSKQTPLA